MSYFEELSVGDVRLSIAPHIGGAITEFSKAGQQLMHKASDRALAELNPGGMSSFPMVPYCNRIQNGRFTYEGRAVELPGNFPPEPHSIHGLGWQAPWQVTETTQDAATLELTHDGSVWPWPFAATQRLHLREDALVQTLSLENRADGNMPAGLGVHPFFGRDDRTVFRASFAGEWETDDEKIPSRLNTIPAGQDLWEGNPVATRPVDNVYTDRQGDLRIAWPGEQFGLAIRPSDNLTNTVVYVPVEYNFFCVEPVTHLPNAVNMAGVETGVVDLAPGGTLTVAIEFLIEDMGSTNEQI
jgi:aldose 1-epimerase